MPRSIRTGKRSAKCLNVMDSRVMRRTAVLRRQSDEVGAMCETSDQGE